jgi:hypothetical protein
LALRQTEGLIRSILDLLGLDLAVPDHSTMSRRAEMLDVPPQWPPDGKEPVHLLVDSTGLRLCGPGEWPHERHGGKRRRAWRKLHLATDADTGRMVPSRRLLEFGDSASDVLTTFGQLGRAASFRPPSDNVAMPSFNHAWAASPVRRVTSA